MKYNFQCTLWENKRGGHIFVETHPNGATVVISPFDWLKEQLAHINPDRVLSEALNEENYEAMQVHESLKNFFIRIKDAEPTEYETVMEILKRNDQFLFTIASAI